MKLWLEKFTNNSLIVLTYLPTLYFRILLSGNLCWRKCLTNRYVLESFYLENFARKNVVQTDDLESFYLEIKQTARIIFALFLLIIFISQLTEYYLQPWEWFGFLHYKNHIEVPCQQNCFQVYFSCSTPNNRKWNYLKVSQDTTQPVHNCWDT